MGYPVLSEEEIEEGQRLQRSRALKFTLDEETKTVTDFKEYSVDGFYSSTMGSAQILEEKSDTVLFSWGGKAQPGMPLFSESSGLCICTNRSFFHKAALHKL